MLGETLLIPEKADVERDAVAIAWKNQGGIVQAIGKFWQKPQLATNQVCIYGNDTFALVLAQVLGKRLLSPQDEMIAEVSMDWIKRRVKIVSSDQVAQLHFPCFVKPVQPKLFAAQIHHTIQSLQTILQGLSNPFLICSEVIEIEKEVRAFVLNGALMDLAYYKGEGDLNIPHQFMQDFLQQCSLSLPKAFVVDAGFNPTLGWFVIEFNAAWGAGLNGCNPTKVLPCIKAATID